MKEIRVANRYAKALLELAIELNVLQQIKADAELVSTVCRQNRDFVLMLKSPVIKEKKKLSVVKEIFKDKLNQLFFQFLVIITRNRREDLIPEISNQFIVLYKKYKNILPANLSTSVEVDNETRQKLINLLHKHTKSEIELTEEVKKELIGGFILSFEDKQYDASIQRKIKNLKKEFEINLYVKGF
jgi:F-type H+-transporting ATPase subunit delta